jgi:uncharacterized protein YndB with AHSA1/START domain
MRALALLAALCVAGPVVAQAVEEPPATEVVAPPPVEVATRTEADGTTTLTHSALVAAPITEVWTAVSTPEGWVTWAVPLARWAEGESDILETSYNPAELAGGPGAIWQQFIARIPGRLLVFRTIKTPDDFPHGDAYKKVTGIFELASEGAGTRVRLTSTGYPDSEGGRALAGFFATGNAATLEGLQRRFVEGPKVWAVQPAE